MKSTLFSFVASAPLLSHGQPAEMPAGMTGAILLF